MGSDRYARSFRRKFPIRRPRHWTPRKRFALTLILLDIRVECFYTPRRGYHISRVLKLRGGLRLVYSFPPPEVSAVKKKVPGSASSASLASHLAPLESSVFGTLFNLVSHCCVTRYDDGDPRQPGWFTVKTLGSAWAVQVKDPDSCCQMQAIGNTLDDALGLADLLLGSDEAPWEPDPWAKKKAAEKKK